jgi:hypothetical protein
MHSIVGHPNTILWQSMQSMKTINELVKDWGGFEKLVAALHETGDVTVEHNAHLVGKSGAPRQIDVLLRHKQGLYEHLVVVECKYWNTAVERLHVDALATTVREVGAAKGVIFTTKGFQSGALAQATHDNIELFTVRELTNEEWGLPGKVIDLFLQVNAVSIGDPQFLGTFSFSGFEPRNPRLDITIGKPESDSRTPMFKDGDPEKTLEEYLSRIARESAGKFYPSQPIVFRNGGYEGKLLLRGKVNVAPKSPIRINVHGGVIMVPRIEFDVGLLINQSRITIDRSNNYFFALAVEDCVRNRASHASKKLSEAATVIEPFSVPDSMNPGDIVKNGSLISVWVNGFESFGQFAGLTYGQLVEA